MREHSSEAARDGTPAEGPDATVLDAEGVRALLLLEALEEEDPGGELVGLGERRRAGDDTGESAGGALAQLVERGRAVARIAAERGLWREAHASGGGAWLAVALLLTALVAGFAVAGLGTRRELNVLANPLAGLVVWNLAVYALVLVVPRIAGGLRAPGPVSAGLARLFAWARKPARRWLTGEAARRARVRARLAASWTRAGAPLHFARTRLLLHVAAIAFAAGAVASTYRSGLVLEYRATWESTFLDAGAVRAVLRILLGPAPELSGLGLPSASALEALRAPGSGDAAPWIHLWSTAIAVWVGLPRALLALGAALSARRLARALPFELREHAVILRLSRASRGQGREVRILPYSLELDARRKESLLAFAADVHGARARLVVEPPLAYGAEPEAEDRSAAGAPSLVLVFNLAQTPEAEVHGRLVEGLAARARGAEHESESAPRLVVLVDSSTLRERLGAGEEAERRVAERARAWESALREAGATPLVIDLAHPSHENLALRAAEALGA